MSWCLWANVLARQVYMSGVALDMPRAKILVVDQDVPWTLKLSDLLIQDECEMFSANSVQDAMLLLDARSIDMVIAEINMPGVGWDGVFGADAAGVPRGDGDRAHGQASVEQAVKATKLGVIRLHAEVG